MAKKGYQKLTPEELARQLENQRRLYELAEKRLRDDGITREELHRRLGWPAPPPGRL